MKYLYLIRHAKSSWKDDSLKDHQRPLNQRGLRDAPFMGNLLKEKGIQPDILVSSYAVRALRTAKIIAEELGYPKKKIEVIKDAYLASFPILMDIVSKLDDKHKVAFLFGHNPDFTTFANTFSDEYIPNVPTCGIVEIKFDIKKWKNINLENGKVMSFEFPKKYK